MHALRLVWHAVAQRCNLNTAPTPPTWKRFIGGIAMLRRRFVFHRGQKQKPWDLWLHFIFASATKQPLVVFTASWPIKADWDFWEGTTPSWKKKKKNDLTNADLLVENIYDVHVRNRARKAELRHVSSVRLMKNGVPTAEAVSEAEVGARVCRMPKWRRLLPCSPLVRSLKRPLRLVVVNMSTEGLHLALKIKKVETRSVCSPKRRLPFYWVWYK